MPCLPPAPSPPLPPGCVALRARGCRVGRGRVAWHVVVVGSSSGLLHSYFIWSGAAGPGELPALLQTILAVLCRSLLLLVAPCPSLRRLSAVLHRLRARAEIPFSSPPVVLLPPRLHGPSDLVLVAPSPTSPSLFVVSDCVPRDHARHTRPPRLPSSPNYLRTLTVLFVSLVHSAQHPSTRSFSMPIASPQCDVAVVCGSGRSSGSGQRWTVPWSERSRRARLQASRGLVLLPAPPVTFLVDTRLRRRCFVPLVSRPPIPLASVYHSSRLHAVSRLLRLPHSSSHAPISRIFTS